MTRRILLVLLAFTATVLVAAVVPLTLDASNHDRTSFIQATAGMANTDAAIAQSRLDAIHQNPAKAKNGGLGADPPLVNLFNQTKQAGNGLLIFEGGPRQNQLLVNRQMPPGDWVRLANQANTQGRQARRSNQPFQAVTV